MLLRWTVQGACEAVPASLQAGWFRNPCEHQAEALWLVQAQNAGAQRTLHMPKDAQSLLLFHRPLHVAKAGPRSCCTCCKLSVCILLVYCTGWSLSFTALKLSLNVF